MVVIFFEHRKLVIVRTYELHVEGKKARYRLPWWSPRYSPTIADWIKETVWALFLVIWPF